MIADKSFSWGNTTQQSHLLYQHTAALVVATRYRAKSLLPTAFGSKLHEPFYTTGFLFCFVLFLDRADHRKNEVGKVGPIAEG